MIPFNKPYYNNETFDNIKQALVSRHVSGDGVFTKKSSEWMENKFNCKKILLTHSCTAALEMMAILTNIQSGDEVIMPSYTFVSTANAFLLQGATPVFVDIREDTLNIDENLIEEAITDKTKAIVPVHYAGVGCEMDKIMKIAKKHDLKVLEDSAQGFASKYKGKDLGTIGTLGAISFHETKNIGSGEGGALYINNPEYIQNAEIIREKGTNRSSFFRGEIDKYTWVKPGSSYLPSDIIAAYLYSQLTESEQIINKRLKDWETYHSAFKDLETKGLLRRPIIPKECTHNAHIYYILLPDLETRSNLITYLKEKEIHTVFHYVPLHLSPAGKEYARYNGDMKNTNELSDRIVRLPLFYTLTDEMQNEVIQAIYDFFKEKKLI